MPAPLNTSAQRTVSLEKNVKGGGRSMRCFGDDSNQMLLHCGQFQRSKLMVDACNDFARRMQRRPDDPHHLTAYERYTAPDG